ncbi:hypothetical protein Gogos_009014 [Gossypium gossypioides]|uniref:Uncharacterized protein n=1 Tax=Gossypium gossypioides TaxID=34282 RepID=A0A7J9CDY3_GOSGO|nr:hypothetical protein [Gossypium gossypioides]
MCQRQKSGSLLPPLSDSFMQKSRRFDGVYGVVHEAIPKHNWRHIVYAIHRALGETNKGVEQTPIRDDSHSSFEPTHPEQQEEEHGSEKEEKIENEKEKRDEEMDFEEDD